MATIRGCLTIIQSGVVPATVAEVREIRIERSTPEEDTSVMGDCTKKFSAGAVETTVRMNGFANHWPGSDPAPDPGQQNFDIGNNVDVLVRPNGTGSGKPQLSFNMVVLADSQGADVNTSWSREVSGRINGAIDDTAQV